MAFIVLITLVLVITGNVVMARRRHYEESQSTLSKMGQKLKVMLGLAPRKPRTIKEKIQFYAHKVTDTLDDAKDYVKNTHPIDATKESIERAADKTKEAIHDAADRTKEAINNAAKKTKKAVENAKDYVTK